MTFSKLQLTEALDLFDEHLLEIRDAMADTVLFYMEMEKTFTPLHTQNTEHDAWYYCTHLPLAVKANIQNHIDKQKNTIRRIQYRINAKKAPALYKNRITDNDIAQAKEMPLCEIYPLKINKAGFCLCPFHNEKTPSMKIYKENTFKCFGCGAWGDAITFYMQMNNVDFVSAVKKLCNHQ